MSAPPKATADSGNGGRGLAVLMSRPSQRALGAHTRMPRDPKARRSPALSRSTVTISRLMLCSVEAEGEEEGERADLAPRDGEEHEDLEHRGTHGHQVAPALLVGNAVATGREADDRHQPEERGRRQDAEQHPERGIEVAEHRPDHEGLRLMLVDEAALVHSSIVVDGDVRSRAAGSGSR